MNDTTHDFASCAANLPAPCDMFGDTPTYEPFDPTSFHVFEYRGRRLLYDVNTTAVLEVESIPAFELLKELEQGNGTTDKTDKATEQLLEELALLKTSGLFGSEVPESEESAESYLESLFDHHPNKILLIVSQSCNYRCAYCYAVENNYHDEGKLMDEETALRAVDYLFRVSGERKHLIISFFGGEPLLNFPVVKKVIEYSEAKALEEGREVEFLMSSNASLVTNEIGDYLVDHQVSMLVSLDGPPEIHNRFRPTKTGGPTHDLSLKGARKLLQRYPRKSFVKVKAVMNHENHDLRKIVEYLEDLGFTNIGVGGSRQRPWGCQDLDLCGSDFSEISESTESLLDRFLSRLDNDEPLGFNPFYSALTSLGRKRRMPGITCGVGRNTNAVDVDGHIYPCHRYVGMEKFVIGDIEHGLDREKTMDYYRRLRKNAVDSCSSCWARHTCGGECPWYVSKDDGSIWPPLPRSCEDTRKSTERAIWLFFELEKRHPEYLERIRKQ